MEVLPSPNDHKKEVMDPDGILKALVKEYWLEQLAPAGVNEISGFGSVVRV